MTKKDFELIASILARAYWSHSDTPEKLSIVKSIVESFACVLAMKHPRFDTERFLNACVKLPR